MMKITQKGKITYESERCSKTNVPTRPYRHTPKTTATKMVPAHHRIRNATSTTKPRFGYVHKPGLAVRTRLCPLVIALKDLMLAVQFQKRPIWLTHRAKGKSALSRKLLSEGKMRNPLASRRVSDTFRRWKIPACASFALAIPPPGARHSNCLTSR